MAVVPCPVIKRIRERLINIQHPEVRLWQDEDLKTAVFKNGPKWFDLLKWLLTALDNSLESLLENPKQSITENLQDVIISLGFKQASDVHKCVSGEVSIKERERFVNAVISAIELERKYSQNDSLELNNLTKKVEKVSFEEYRSIGKILKKGKKKETGSYKKVLQYMEEVNKAVASEEEEQAKYLRLIQEKDKNLTLSQHLDQLKEERKLKLETLTSLSSTVEEMWQSVCEINKSEWEPILPESIPEARKMPKMKELTSNVDYLSKHQETLKTVEKCMNVLRNRRTLDRDLKWSVKNTESLPLNDCFKQIYSVKTQIADLNRTVKLDNASLRLNDTSVKFNDTSVKFNDTSVKFSDSAVKLNTTDFT